MDALRWGRMFDKLLNAKRVDRGQGSSANKRHSQSATIADVARDLGVSERTARDRLAQADQYEALPKSDRQAIDRGTCATVAQVRRAILYTPSIRRNAPSSRPSSA